MEGHNRTYPSRRWVGMDDEQIVWKSGSFDVQSRSRSDSAVRHNRKLEKARCRTGSYCWFSLAYPCGWARFSGPGRTIGGDGVAGRSTACLWAYGKRIVSSNHAKPSIL